MNKLDFQFSAAKNISASFGKFQVFSVTQILRGIKFIHSWSSEIAKAISETFEFFWKFQHCKNSQFFQNSKLEPPETVKNGIYWVSEFTKIVSRKLSGRKIAKFSHFDCGMGLLFSQCGIFIIFLSLRFDIVELQHLPF